MAQQIVRYGLDGFGVGMEPQPTGDWVRWDDAFALLEEVRRLRGHEIPVATTDVAWADALAAVQAVYPQGVMAQTILYSLGYEPGSRWVAERDVVKAIEHARALAALPLRGPASTD